jgi:hypothetical protein
LHHSIKIRAVQSDSLQGVARTTRSMLGGRDRFGFAT